MRITAIVNGYDDLAWVITSGPLASRLSKGFSTIGWNVIGADVLVPNTLENTLPFVPYTFQATLTLDTGATSVPDARQAIVDVVTTVTGNAPSVAIPQAGDPTPLVPQDESGFKLVANVASLLNVTTQTATAIVVVLGIGIAYLVVEIAKHPERAVRVARG